MRIFFLLSLYVISCAAEEAPIVVSKEFLDACTEGDIDALKQLLDDHPLWVNGRSAQGETCLHVAGIKGQAQVTRLILEKGGDANIRTTFEEGLRMHPLSWNVYGGHYETVAVLLEEGKANPNLDYDKKKGSAPPITVLDTVLEILGNDDPNEPDPRLERYYKTKELLLKHGAKRYRDLQASDQEL